MASEWQIIKDLYKGFGNNPRNAETFEAIANMNPLFSAYRGAKTLSNVDVSPMRKSLLNEAYGISDPNVNKQAANQVKDTLFGLLDVAPVAGAATPAIKAGGKTLAKEAARQIETGTGLLGSSIIDPRTYITAFQGSPKLFDKFDKSKIGSGSGMDYGYGGYFSESPSVATQYMGDADKFITTVDNQVIDTPILQSIIRMGGKPEEFIKSMSDKLKSQEKALKAASKEELLPSISDYDIAKLDYNSTLNKINEAKSYVGKNIQKKREGNLYKVDIPDEQLPYFINWDSAQQTPEVASILKNAGIYNPGKTGQDLYFNAMDKAGNSDATKSGFQKASEYLNSLGIKGNKYTDRTYGTVAKDPTNYVVYNPEEIKILERNGLLLP